jgi:hypothetical protein
MSVNIKNREVAALLDEIKAATGKGASQIVLELLRKEAGRLRRRRGMVERRARIEAISRRYSARLSAHPPPPEALVGYDEDGLPTGS